MLEPLQAYLLVIARTLRIADVIDIAVVSVIVYAAVSWFRRSRSRLVMSGLATLALLYLVAGLLDMHLTLALFQAGITVAVIALVVIFQEEIRRGFERIALASRFEATGVTENSAPEVDTLVEAAVNLANARTGALIVLRGREPLARHLTGGFALNGQLSEPLLYSIFDANSAGHDGALIVENGLAVRFGTHLPLSSALKGKEHFGTRHAAAMGLSERSDALVIVVSEERGVISVAEDGSLTEVESSADLKRHILDFQARIAPQRPEHPVRQLFTKSLGIKILSVAVALAAWLVAFGYRSDTAIRTLNVPVVFKNVPDGWIIEDPRPFEVLVSLSGPKRQLESLQSSDVNVAVDVSKPSPGVQRTTISSSEVEAPNTFSVRSVEPSTLRFVAQRTVTTSAAVQAQTVGRLPHGYRVTKITTDPPEVDVVVPKSAGPGTRHVMTEPIRLESVDRNTTLRRQLLLPSGMTLASGEPTSVNVSIEVNNAP